MPPSRHFSLDEANRALAQIAPLLVRLKALHTTATQLQDRLAALWRRLERGERVLDEIAALDRQLEAQTQEAAAARREVEAAGCILRDVQMGLVDFPAQAAGTDIFLCWRLGEDAIGFWHGTDEGFAGRRPVSALPGARLH
jgi:hypothetical protein